MVSQISKSLITIEENDIISPEQYGQMKDRKTGELYALVSMNS